MIGLEPFSDPFIQCRGTIHSKIKELRKNEALFFIN